MWKYIAAGIIIIAVYLIIQGIRCHIAVSQGTQRLEKYAAQTIELSYGDMTFVDEGEGETILSVHGIFGGYDQAFDTCIDLNSEYRILAPSRFGYLGSDTFGNGTPAEQSAAYIELLDKLEIEKVWVLATSAGGSVAIKFALDYPQRTNGLILYCSGMPPASKPEEIADYAGPPAFLVNDFAMFLLSPLFEPIMGMESSTIYSMLPISERRNGVVLDASVTNLDMERNYYSYQVESLQVPTLILHAKDDKLASYEDAANAALRFPDCTFISFESGGHLMTNHREEIKRAVTEFISKPT